MTKEYWQSITYDTVSLQAAQTKLSFFVDEHDNSSNEDLRLIESIATKFLLENFKSQLMQLVGINKNDALVLSEVSKPFTDCSKIPGDIDIIVFSKADPRRSVAIELKVLRKRIRNNGNNYIDGLDKLSKGCRQCEGLLSMGFGSVALGVILLANTSYLNEVNLACRQLRDDSWDIIRQEFFKLIGEKPIGLLNLEINQTTPKPISDCGSISGINFRESFQSQSPEISEKLFQISRG